MFIVWRGRAIRARRADGSSWFRFRCAAVSGSCAGSHFREHRSQVSQDSELGRAG